MGVQFAGNILVQSNGGPLPIVNGGTGQTSASAAFNALAPSQTGQSGKVLTTNGTTTSWTTISGSPGGADTNIQYNDAGTFGGSSFLTVNKSTGAITSTSTLTNQGLLVTGTAASDRPITFQTAGSNRWVLKANSTAESGSNVGSDFQLIRYADNGSTQNTVFTATRSTGVVDFAVAPTVGGSAITAAANTLTGTTLASNVVSSSLTSVGTLGSLSVTNDVTVGGVITTGGVEVGLKIIPQNSQSAAYTLVLSDSGKQIFHPTSDSTARTWTIPANSSVAYPIGTALTFINQNGAGIISIAINTDTMRLAGAGTSGTRTLAANGVATAIKITSTEWIISGTGLT